MVSVKIGEELNNQRMVAAKVGPLEPFESCKSLNDPTFKTALTTRGNRQLIRTSDFECSLVGRCQVDAMDKTTGGASKGRWNIIISTFIILPAIWLIKCKSGSSRNWRNLRTYGIKTVYLLTMYSNT